MMTRILILCCAVVVLTTTGVMSAWGQFAGFRDFELVESTPVETSLDNPDIRNTAEVW